MLLLIVTLSLLVVLYISIIIAYIYGFIKIKHFKFGTVNNKLDNKIYLSIIIPFKNEEQNLSFLIENLKNQSLNKSHFEILFINDNSSDNSEIIVKEQIKDIPNFKLINQKPNLKGKKNALKTGVSNAIGELIVTSDADCSHQKDWLQQILYFHLKYKPKMIIAPVLMKGQNFFEKMQSLEFLSLIASTAGAAGIKHPIMCNGANLAFEKDVFFEFDDALKSEETSGDDVFLLHNIKKKYPKKIKYLKTNDTIVFTDAQSTLKSFFKQRIRWASKSKSYFDFDTILSSVIVLFINILIIALLTASFFNLNAFYVFIPVFSLKILFDFTLLFLAAHFFKQKGLLKYFPLLIIFYPFYIVFTAIFSVFVKEVEWKS